MATLVIEGQRFIVKHKHEPLDHRNQRSWLNNSELALAPNALGESTCAGNYMTNVERHPNGLPNTFDHRDAFS